MDSSQKLTIVTTCTNQKRGSVPENLHLGRFAGRFYRDSAKAWIEGLKADHPTSPAGELYVGSHWKESLACEGAATDQGLHSDLWVLSAGYGLISKKEQIAPYAASFASGGDSIQNLTWPDDYSPKQKAQEWWALLHRYRKQSNLSRNHPPSRFELPSPTHPLARILLRG